MPQRANRMCSLCHQTTLPGQRHCAKHRAETRNRPRNDLRRLYKCKAWYQTRTHVIFDQPICTWEENGVRVCPHLSTDVHHVIEAEEWMRNGGDFYDQTNLAGLCHAHHSVHTARTQGFAVRR